MSPLKNLAAPSPAKMHAYEMDEKAGSIFDTCARVPLRDYMNKRLSTKPGWGRTAPVCSAGLSWLHIIMAAANCSPAVASRRAKYDGDFRVPTLLGAQPLGLAAHVCQRTTHNADMAIEPEEGGKLAHGRLQSALPVRAKTRRQPSRLMGPQGCSAGATPGRSQRPLFLYRGGWSRWGRFCGII